MDTDLDDERFQRDGDKYADHLETPEERLRIDLAVANLEEPLPKPWSLCALWIWGAVPALLRLAQLGFHVTLLDHCRRWISPNEPCTESDLRRKLC